MFKAIGLVCLLLTEAPTPPPALTPSEPTSYREKLEELLGSTALQGGQSSLVVKRVRDSAPLFEYNPDQLLIPASTIKLFTSALALETLGPDYRFKTQLHGTTSLDGSSITGNIYLKGFGDPWFVPEQVWQLGQRLKATGVKGISGDIIIDHSFFSGPTGANGIEQDTSSKAYMAPAGAVSVGFNAVAVHVRPNSEVNKPAHIYIEPGGHQMVLEGTIKTVEGKATYYGIEIEPFGTTNKVILSGNIHPQEGPQQTWRRITNPPHHAGAVFAQLLRETGITVEGKILSGLTPPQSPLLAEIESPRLADLLSKVNKYSNNFMASQIGRAVGAHIYGAPGTWAKAEKAMQRYLQQNLDLPPTAYSIKNASGLHDLNRVTTRQIIELLEHVYNQPRLRIEYLNSLAVTGGTGTLEKRMHQSPTKGLLRGKTGTLSVASALSGYVYDRDGELLVFAFITNHFKNGITPVIEIQDQIGDLLASTSFAPNAALATSHQSP